MTADEMEAEGWAPWLQKQPVEDLARRFEGRKWVPLDAVIPALQFWQRRDYEHSVAADILRQTKAKAPPSRDRRAKRRDPQGLDPKDESAISSKTQVQS